MKIGALLTALLAGAGAYACIGSYYEGVHFHNGNPDFGTPPRRAMLYWEHDDRPEGSGKDYDGDGDRKGMELTSDSEDAARTRREVARTRLLKQAGAQEKTGAWAEAARFYTRAGEECGWNVDDLRDRVDVLRRFLSPAERNKAPVDKLQAYLAALTLDEARKRPEARIVFEHLYADRSAGFLREHALYQLACLAHAYFDYGRAITLFQQELREFPQTAKREAALLMIARCAILPQLPQSQQPTLGRQSLDQLLREFPHTRFKAFVPGLRARLLLIDGRYVQAIRAYIALHDMPSAEIVLKTMPHVQAGKSQSQSGATSLRADVLAAYLRELDRAKTYAAYTQALNGINHLREKMTGADSARFTRLLLQSDDLAAPYLYYRLYHCDNKPADLMHLARLADKYAARHATGKIAPRVRIRLAEAYYQHRQYDRALPWCESAIASVEADRALYVRGAIRHKRRDLTGAIADYTTLLKQCPHSGLRHGAREELGLLYEAVGEPGKALDEYFLLNYPYDQAYLLDARMSTAQVAEYRQHNTDPKRHDLLTYTLGIRLLRDGKWALSQTVLRQLPHSVYKKYAAARKEMDYKDCPGPLIVAQQLGHLQRAIRNARTANARAQAMYEYASYFSTHGVLVLYNNALWDGAREYMFQFHWNDKAQSSQDKIAVRTHMYRHEVYLRSRDMCLQVAREYPDSPVAPRALYRAACAAWRMSNFNYWWSQENDRHDYRLEAIRLMAQLARRYPKHSLAWHARKYARVFREARAEWVADSRR